MGHHHKYLNFCRWKNNFFKKNSDDDNDGWERKKWIIMNYFSINLKSITEKRKYLKFRNGVITVNGDIVEWL